jgi:hypothetical protein
VSHIINLWLLTCSPLLCSPVLLCACYLHCCMCRCHRTVPLPSSATLVLM